EYSLRTDGAGSGEFIGGAGVTRTYRAMTDKQFVSATFGRNKFFPWGLNGGDEGSPNEFVIEKTTGETDGPFGIYPRYPLNKGDVVRLMTATGGGYGDPLKRPHEQVAKDVRNGYISIEQAKEIYGVLVNEETFKVEGLMGRGV